MLVRKTLGVEPLDPTACPEAERRWLEYLSGFVAAGTVSADGCEFAAASVHALARRVEVGTAVTLAEHERIRRTGLDRAIYSDLAATALAPGSRDAVSLSVATGTTHRCSTRSTPTVFTEWRDRAPSSSNVARRPAGATLCDASTTTKSGRTWIRNPGCTSSITCSPMPRRTTSSWGAMWWTMRRSPDSAITPHWSLKSHSEAPGFEPSVGA